MVYACVSIGFCALNILSKFGELSGLSSAPFDSSILKLMSEVDNSGSDLHGDSQTKAKWILSMVTLNSASMFCVQGAILCRYYSCMAKLIRSASGHC